jgi:hypothetical protein
LDFCPFPPPMFDPSLSFLLPSQHTVRNTHTHTPVPWKPVSQQHPPHSLLPNARSVLPRGKFLLVLVRVPVFSACFPTPFESRCKSHGHSKLQQSSALLLLSPRYKKKHQHLKKNYKKALNYARTRMDAHTHTRTHACALPDFGAARDFLTRQKRRMCSGAFIMPINASGQSNKIPTLPPNPHFGSIPVFFLQSWDFKTRHFNFTWLKP